MEVEGGGGAGAGAGAGEEELVGGGAEVRCGGFIQPGTAEEAAGAGEEYEGSGAAWLGEADRPAAVAAVVRGGCISGGGAAAAAGAGACAAAPAPPPAGSTSGTGFAPPGGAPRFMMVIASMLSAHTPRMKACFMWSSSLARASASFISWCCESDSWSLHGRPGEPGFCGG